MRGRYPMSINEMNPGDMPSLKVEAGDIVAVFNAYGSTHAMAYPEPDPSQGADIPHVRAGIRLLLGKRPQGAFLRTIP